MLGADDLVLCAGTLLDASFQQHVAAAAAGGFQGISLYATEYQRARGEGLSDADLRALLDDHGLEIAELDPLMNWLPAAGLGRGATEEGNRFFGATEADFYAMGEALAARSINAVLFTDERVETERIAEAFAGLCDRAAERGLLIHLEYLPWTQIPDLATALAIVELAGRSNGGLMVDSWHHFRSHSDARDNEALRKTPGERILAVQLNDAPRAPAPNAIEETLHGRLLPGEGDIDLGGLLGVLKDNGCRAPIGVEVFSDAMAALSPEEVGRRTAATTRAVIARVGR